MKTTCIAIVAAAMASAAIGLASPASAEPLSGSYNALVINGGGVLVNGQTVSWTLSSCGPDCLRVDNKFDNGRSEEFHLQGNTWIGPSEDGCTDKLDNNSLVDTIHCSDGSPDMVYQLTKKG
jgi:hypothetical protein